MGKIYAVSSGEYSDYSIMKVFSSLEAAERYIVQYNKRCSKYYDEAFLEIMDLDDVEDIESFEIYRYINFSFYGQTKNYCWSMEFTDQPIDDLQIIDSLEKPGFFYGKIPVTRTYDDRNEKDCRLVEKIIQDNIARYKAEQAGL